MANACRWTTLERGELASEILKRSLAQGRSQPMIDMIPTAENFARDPVPLPALPATPKISCLMISKNKLSIVRRAVACYLAQTYPNKELVVLRDARFPSPELDSYLAGLDRTDIKNVRTSEQTLPGLRDASVAAACGEICCQWDDDDLSHPDRLMIQLQPLISDGAAASCLQEGFDFWVKTNEMFQMNRQKSPLRCLPGTVMFRREAATPYLPTALKGEEDSTFMLSMNHRISIVHGMPHLYVYVFHDDNTCDEHHRRKLINTHSVDADEQVDEYILELSKVGLTVSRPSSGRAYGCSWTRAVESAG